MKKMEISLPKWFSDADIETAVSALECYGGKVHFSRLENSLVVEFPSDDQLQREEPSLRKVINDLINSNHCRLAEVLYDQSTIDVPGSQDTARMLKERGDIIEHDFGIYSYQGEFHMLKSLLDKKVHEFGLSLGAIEIDYPNFISLAKLRRTSFLEHYPQLLNFVFTPKQNHEYLSGITAALKPENQAHLHKFLEGPEHICRSSSCLHTYMNHADKVLEKNLVYSTVGKCSRQENPSDKNFERLREFSMREIIFLGESEFVESQLTRCSDFVKNLMVAGPLKGVFQTSNDLFFPDQLAALQFYQKSQRAKLELRLQIPEESKTISVASLNRHTNYFSNSYSIALPNGELAKSGCFAFGLERLTYALYCQFGLRLEQWPQSLKSFLNIGY